MGYIGPRPTLTAYGQPGLWSSTDAALQTLRGAWDAGRDPYWSSVKLLLQPQAGDNAISDKAGGKTITNTGVTVSGFSPIPGGASLYFNGSAYLDLADQADWTPSSDSVWEVWCWSPAPLANGVETTLINQWPSTGGVSWRLLLDGFQGSSLLQRVVFQQSADGSSIWNGAADTGYRAGMINHIAVSYVAASGAVYYHINGAPIFSQTRGGFFNSPGVVRVGATGATSPAGFFTGHIFALRFTNGTARGYPGSTVLVPTGPWPTR